MNPLVPIVRLREATRAFGSALFGHGFVRYSGVARPGFDAYGSWTRSPRNLRDMLMYDPDGTQIRWHARRAAESSEYIGKFLGRSKQSAFFDNHVEIPYFPGVDPEIAVNVSNAWAEWWTEETDSRGRIHARAEKLHFRDWLVDGEIFFDWPAGRLRAIPPDMIRDCVKRPGDYAPEAWLLQNGGAIAASELIHAAIIQSNWKLRGTSYLAKALPELFWEMDFRDITGEGIRAMAKVSAMTTHEETGNAAAIPPMAGYDPIGGDDAPAAVDTRFGGAFVADMARGESLEAARYGPPENAVLRADASPGKVATALEVSVSEITGDHYRHNFASLQVADVRDARTYRENRQDFYEAFRVPVFKKWLQDRLADSTFPPRYAQWASKLNPRWRGPKITTAQPVKDAQAMRLEAEMGQISLRRIAASQGENALANAAENAAILAAAGASDGQAGAGDDETGEKLDAILASLK